MSWWTSLRNGAETFASGGANLLGGGSAANQIEGGLNNIFGRQNAAQKRDLASQVNNEIQAYKDATNAANALTSQTQAQEKATQAQINQKQIRNLRGTYRSGAGLLSTNPTPTGLGTGNEPGLTNKLGNA